MRLLFKILGILLLLTGILLSVNPQWLTHLPQTIDGYEMIENRVPYGLLIGFGVLMIINSSWSSWKLTASLIMSSTSLGIAVARSIGLLCDGIYVKQYLWLAIEVLIALSFGLLYKYLKRRNPNPDAKAST